MKTDADFFISSPQAIQYAYLSAQGRCFKLRLPFLTPTNRSIGSVRGMVGEFSRASRKRMLEMVARLDLERVSHITFISVTYPERDGPPTAKNSSRDLEVFWKRLKRKIPNASGIWRREWEDRKSGAFTGVLYPHFHILLFDIPFIPLAFWFSGNNVTKQIDVRRNFTQRLTVTTSF